MDTHIITLSVSTAQGAFDKVCKHLAQMRQRAAIDRPEGGSNCMYETEKGEHCAIGALMVLDTPAKHAWAREAVVGAEDLVEGHTTHTDMPFLIRTEIEPELLTVLQEVHDNAGNWADGEGGGGFVGWSHLEDIAAEWGLSKKAIRCDQPS